MKKPKHSANFIFGNSPKARAEAKKVMERKVLCEGCVEELASKIDEVYKFRYLLEKAAKKLRKQKIQLRIFRLRWKELREVLRTRGMPDVGMETNLIEHFARWRDEQRSMKFEKKVER